MNTLNRRSLLKYGGTAIAASILPGMLSAKNGKNITHVYSLSFDDGFRGSFEKVAEIYEKYKLKACFNVIATAHERNFQAPDEYQAKGTYGDFDLWNDLKKRGHEIMPHTYRHENLTKIPFEEAKGLMNRCFEYFQENLDGYKQEEAIYNFAFNASNQALEDWLSEKVLAFRTSGPVVNMLPHEGQKKLTCISYGPDNADKFLKEQTDAFLKNPQGWFIFNTHGLNGEGWGPISSGFLDELIDDLSKKHNVAVLPVGLALKKYA
jgi:peptidoglycan/xylan/chitin deacetylase (PgdA/CDA1 family)